MVQSSMASRKTTVPTVFHAPWFTGSDRDYVANLLFDEDVENQKKGLRRLSTWMARSHPNVPLALEVTSTLISAMIASNEAETVTDRAEMEQSSNLLLSVAMVRFVNLIVQLQTIVGAPNKLIIAAKKGIPEWVVEVRHSVAHSHMPSTEVLKRAAKYGLDFLKKFYWKDETPTDFLSKKCFKVSDTKKENIVRSLQNPYEVTEKILNFMKGIQTDDVIDILTRNGVLLITTQQLNELMAKGYGDQDIITKLEEIWTPFFESFQGSEVSYQVMTYIIELTTKSDDVLYQKMGMVWVKILYKILHLTSGQREYLRKTLYDLPINTTSISIIEAIKSIKETTELSSRKDKSEDISNENSNWVLQSSESWQEFPIGVDKDDWKWSPNKLELKIPIMSNDKIEMITSKFEQVIEPKIVEKLRKRKRNDKSDSVLQQNVHLL